MLSRPPHSVNRRGSSRRDERPPPSLAPNSNPTQEPATSPVTGVTEPRDRLIDTTGDRNPAPAPSRSDTFYSQSLDPTFDAPSRLKREVEIIVRKQEDELRRKPPAQPLAPDSRHDRFGSQSPNPARHQPRPAARLKLGQSKPFLFPRIGSHCLRAPGHPSGNTGPPPLPATSRSTSRIQSWSATATALSNSSDLSAGT